MPALARGGSFACSAPNTGHAAPGPAETSRDMASGTSLATAPRLDVQAPEQKPKRFSPGTGRSGRPKTHNSPRQIQDCLPFFLALSLRLAGRRVLQAAGRAGSCSVRPRLHACATPGRLGQVELVSSGRGHGVFAPVDTGNDRCRRSVCVRGCLLLLLLQGPAQRIRGSVHAVRGGQGRSLALGLRPFASLPLASR